MSTTARSMRNTSSRFSPLPADTLPLSQRSNTSEQIPHVRQGFTTIAEERVEDDHAKFWAAYHKSSNEHHIGLVEQVNSDIAIILTFAGLLSAVLATFVVGMQPNPVDTTNVLLLHLIQVTVNPDSVPDLSNILSSTEPPPLAVWTQTLAYASFMFSLLAALGAVLGKQWLNPYNAGEQGTLEERGIQRQMKLDGLKSFRMQVVMRACLTLLHISLLFFCFSLSINAWTQQITIYSVIVPITTFGLMFYMVTILLSVDSPFKTPVSDLFESICQIFLPKRFTFICIRFATSSAVRWMLETSTNPDFVDAAAAIVPLVQWPLNCRSSASYARLLENFPICREKPELYVKYHKAMAHLCIQPAKIDSKLLGRKFWNDEFEQTRICLLHAAFMAGHAAYNQLNSAREFATPPKHLANARTALRTMAVHGQSHRLSRPDDEELIWDGDLRWRHSDGRKPSCEDFDWLIDYLAGDAEHRTDDETMGDALLALSAMQGLGSSTKRQSYIRSLIRCMGSTRPPRVRHTALRAVYEAREELASITSASMPPGVDTQLLDELSRALLTAVRPNDGQTTHDTGTDASFHLRRDSCYIRIIYALIKNDEWFQRLARDGHDERCISLVEGDCTRDWEVGFYLLVVFGRIKSSGRDLPFSPAQEKWRSLIRNTWVQIVTTPESYVDGIPALVTATRLNLTASDGVPKEWHADLAAMVHEFLINLQGKQATLVNDGIAQAVIDAALSSIQGLYDNLSCMVMQRNTLQKEEEDRDSGL